MLTADFTILTVDFTMLNQILPESSMGPRTELQNGFRIDLADQRGQKSVQEKQFLDKDIKI